MHRFSAVLAGVLLTVALLTCSAAAEETIEFNRDIRPILASNCYQCHGPDKGQRQADLRLDEEEAALAVIERGKPQDSELLRRITSDDPDEHMPPASTGKQLTKRQIELLTKWISLGANWQQHWSLQPPRPPAAPEVDSPQVANDIDRFLLHRLKQHKLTFSEPADRRTLIRRVYFDLVGLPPAPEEVDAFVNSKDPRAYEKLVDRLLESPQFGERMAVYWLDLVRYADTNGIHGDNHREHWLYRDYVIHAFNSNMPFDQFTREQLAGDLMPNPTRWQRIASGYNRLNMTTREGGAQPKEYIAKYAADRVRNASTVWLGATLGCAECHDHKFDPYTTKDFYQFAAFFADVQETAVGAQKATRIPTEQQAAEIAELDQQIGQLQKQLEDPTGEMKVKLAASLEAFEKNWADAAAQDFVVRKLAEATAAQGSKVEIVDESIAKVSAAKGRDVITLKVAGEFKGVTGIRLETLADETFPAKGPGLASNGNFVVSEVEVRADGGKPLDRGQTTADHSQIKYGAAAATDGKGDTGWAILPQVGKPHQLVVPLKTAVSASELTVTVHCNYGTQHMPGKLRVSTTTMPAPAIGKQAVPENIVKLLEIDAAARNEKQQQEIAKWHRTIAEELQPLRDEIADAKKQREQVVNAAPMILLTAATKPRTMRVLPRGNWLDDSGEEVLPASPSFLPTIDVKEDRRLNRMDLADWLLDPKNPFVARVMVNRLWKIAFGQGIVRTLDDFGEQGRWPSHPALLDYLAVDFRDNGWNIKRTLRMLVLSNAYQQSSHLTKSLRELDPFNDLYARQSRFRLDAELVRDNALSVSGLLNNKIGGPSAKPYQPAGYWSHLNFPRRTYQHDKDENQYRRGLYTYWCRTFLHPSLRAFDATTREECTVERPRSNTPLAALVLLNDPTYVEAARVLAERAMKVGEAPGKRLQEIFRQVLSRQPSAQEAELLLALAEEHRKQYAEDKEAAQQLLNTGLKPRDETLDPAELAAWTSVSRAVLNLHETITRN